jgi:hypothetical protein
MGPRAFAISNFLNGELADEFVSQMRNAKGGAGNGALHSCGTGKAALCSSVVEPHSSSMGQKVFSVAIGR